ncbi:MAG: hypothetical protein H7844_14175 [Nitrospirae bacterium YQR-1]
MSKVKRLPAKGTAEKTERCEGKEKRAGEGYTEMERIRSEIFETAGKIKAAVYSESQGRFLKLIFFKSVKDSGKYKKLGMAWSDFCSYVGHDRKRIDEQLADLKPFNAEFLVDFANFTGLDYSKIKYLGREISTQNAEIGEGGTIKYDGVVIPITPQHKDDIEALLKRLEDKHRGRRSSCRLRH